MEYSVSRGDTFLTDKGWKKVEDMKIGDKVVSLYGGIELVSINEIKDTFEVKFQEC